MWYNENKEYKERIFVNLAKVSAARQITIPIDICKFLNVKPGNKLLFVEKGNGEVVMTNASNLALREAQEAFRGVADELGVKSDDDVMQMVREIRYGKETK